MNSGILRETRFTTQLRLRLYGSATLAIGLLLLFCKYARAGEPPVFAPLPNQPAFALTNGVILVSPTRLNFGAVEVGKSATNTFLVENFGRGKLDGTASVPAPFKIISGDKYALRDKEVQVVTIVYTPVRAGTNRAAVKFTGGNGAKALVMGKATGK